MTNEERAVKLVRWIKDFFWTDNYTPDKSIAIALVALTEAETRGYARGIEAAAIMAVRHADEFGPSAVTHMGGHAIASKIRDLGKWK